MSDHGDAIRQSLEALYDLHAAGGAVSFTEFAAVSHALFAGYCQLLDKGRTPPGVALAMLGSTVNLYRIFDMESELAPLLRSLAIQFDGQRSVH